MYTSQNICWTYEDQGYYNCNIFSFQADIVRRVEGKQIKLLEHVQKIYYTQHLYQYKKNYTRLSLLLVKTGRTENASLSEHDFGHSVYLIS